MEERAIVRESFVITGRGIVACLQHTEFGLPSGTLLQAKDSGWQWRIGARILIAGLIDRHRRFDREHVQYQHFSFTDQEARDTFIERIIKREDEGIYQYWIFPLDHDAKPGTDEPLRIIYTN